MKYCSPEPPCSPPGLSPTLSTQRVRAWSAGLDGNFGQRGALPLPAGRARGAKLAEALPVLQVARAVEQDFVLVGECDAIIQRRAAVDQKTCGSRKSDMLRSSTGLAEYLVQVRPRSLL